MMMLSEIAIAVNGQMTGNDVLVQGIGTDSRAVVQGQLFVALKGERFDGNQYAIKALEDGAVAVLLSDSAVTVSPAIYVKDTKLALGKLAAYWRNKLTAPVVALTGSNGKTTTKEMLKAILTAAVGEANVHATEGNLNNDIGMPLTLLQAKPQHKYVILEMGMNHLREIAYLSQIAKPNVALINNAGTAHIGELGSRENIAKAKGEIFEGLAEDGIAVINADDAFSTYWDGLNQKRTCVRFSLQQARTGNVTVTANYQLTNQVTKLAIQTPAGDMDCDLQTHGEHNVYNALAATAAAVALGVENQFIVAGLTAFTGVYGRLQFKTALNGALLIDDTYNANPDSMRAAINVLSNQKGRKLFVMGDMAELGDDAMTMHEQIGEYALEHGVEALYTFGLLSKKAAVKYGVNASHFEDLSTLIETVKAQLNSDVVVLVKGSRSMKMERVVLGLQATQEKLKDKEAITCS